MMVGRQHSVELNVDDEGRANAMALGEPQTCIDQDFGLEETCLLKISSPRESIQVS